MLDQVTQVFSAIELTVSSSHSHCQMHRINPQTLHIGTGSGVEIKAGLTSPAPGLELQAASNGTFRDY